MSKFKFQKNYECQNSWLEQAIAENFLAFEPWI
jgi:hypothetical protein